MSLSLLSLSYSSNSKASYPSLPSAPPHPSSVCISLVRASKTCRPKPAPSMQILVYFEGGSQGRQIARWPFLILRVDRLLIQTLDAKVDKEEVEETRQNYTSSQRMFP